MHLSSFSDAPPTVHCLPTKEHYWRNAKFPARPLTYSTTPALDIQPLLFQDILMAGRSMAWHRGVHCRSVWESPPIPPPPPLTAANAKPPLLDPGKLPTSLGDQINGSLLISAVGFRMVPRQEALRQRTRLRRSYNTRSVNATRKHLTRGP